MEFERYQIRGIKNEKEIFESYEDLDDALSNLSGYNSEGLEYFVYDSVEGVSVTDKHI